MIGPYMTVLELSFLGREVSVKTKIKELVTQE